MEQFIEFHIPKHKEKVPLDVRILMDKVTKLYEIYQEAIDGSRLAEAQFFRNYIEHEITIIQCRLRYYGYVPE